MKCKRTEFRDLAGITNANLSTYIKRGKVVLEPDGKTIDTERRENKDFLESRSKNGKGLLAANVVAAPIPAVDTPKFETQKPSRKVIKAAETTTISKYNLELEKMQAELDKKIVDTRLAEQKLATLLGNNIPIDLVLTIIAQLSKSIINNYKSFAEQQLTEICHVHRISEVDRVKIITMNTRGLNNVHSKAVNDARIQMKSAVGSAKLKESTNDEDELGD